MTEPSNTNASTDSLAFSLDAAIAEIEQWRVRYEALYAEFQQRGVDKRGYLVRAMAAEAEVNRLRRALAHLEADKT